MFSFLSKSYVSVTPCGEPPQFALPTPGKHSWWHGQTVPIGGGECCSEYNCTSCGAFREEIFGNGVDTCWGEGDTEMHQERGEDEDGDCTLSLSFAGTWRPFLEMLGLSEDTTNVPAYEEYGYVTSFLPVEAYSIDAEMPCVKIAGRWFMLTPEPVVAEIEAEEIPVPQPRRMRDRKQPKEVFQ